MFVGWLAQRFAFDFGFSLYIGDSDYYFYRFIEKEKRTKPDGVSQPWIMDSDAVGEPGPSIEASAISSVKLMDLANAFQKGVTVETHVYRFKQYKKTFIGSEGELFSVYVITSMGTKDC